jgi:hypothetical protein
MLQSCATDEPLFPPTLLYNEGWLLRLIIDWFSRHDVPDHPLNFPSDGRWYSEALLYSAFLQRYRGDRLAESPTHADGAIGHFVVGEQGKVDLALLPDAQHFMVLEAKMFSKLSSSVINASYFDQASRNVSCIAEVLRLAGRHPGELHHLSFYVLAPESQIAGGVFFRQMDSVTIRQKVERRVSEYEGEKDAWFEDWFQPTMQHIEIDTISWEKLIHAIEQHDPSSGSAMSSFYEKCLQFNQRPQI